MIERSAEEAKQGNKGTTAFSILNISLALVVIAFVIMFVAMSIRSHETIDRGQPSERAAPAAAPSGSI